MWSPQWDSIHVVRSLRSHGGDETEREREREGGLKENEIEWRRARERESARMRKGARVIGKEARLIREGEEGERVYLLRVL